MAVEIIDHNIWNEINLGNYEMSIVARLKGPNTYNIAYMVRLTNPEGQEIDFLLSLEGFKELGELCTALHQFCKQPILANQKIDEKNIEKVKELLTYENIINYTKISALMRK